MQQQIHKNISGLFPALDRKKPESAFIADGKNFIVDLDGPKSAFGFQQPFQPFNESGFMQSFPVGSDIFYFSRNASESLVQVSRYNWLEQRVETINQFAATPGRPKLNLPWSHALVGTFHYFANRTWGILRYDAIEENWEDVTATIGISNIFFITESDGRLIALAEGISAWSAIEDGMDFVTSLQTGAGFQGLSKIGSLESDLDYLGVQKVANGYLTFTSKGVMRSQIIDSIVPFRHITGETKESPLTPWCVTKLNETDVVILTRHGLFRSNDGIFQPWQPLMGEHFKQTLIPPLQQLPSGFVMIHYSQSRDEFYVAFAVSQVVSNYTITYTLYAIREEWGVFNRTHKGFVLVDPESRGVEFQQAYISVDGTLNWLNDSATPLRIEAQNSNAIYVATKTEFPAFSIEGTVIFSTVVRASGFSQVEYSEVAGFYEEAGVQSCFITEEAAEEICVNFPDDSILGAWAISDYSAERIGELLSRGLEIQLLHGAVYELFCHLSCADSEYVQLILDTGHPTVTVVQIDFSSCSVQVQTAFVSVSASVTQLDDGSYELKMRWTNEGGTLLTQATIRPAYAVALPTLTGSVYMHEFSVKDVVQPAIELMPEHVNFGDEEYWLRNFVVLQQIWATFSTSVTVNSELCLIGPVSQSPTPLSLDSFIEVGLLRFSEEVANDEFSLITQLAISCLDTTEDLGSTTEDWLNDFASEVEEDWLALPEEVIDWGLELTSGNAYTARIRGTLDGYQTFEDQDVIPDVEQLQGKTKFVTCENQGIFQLVKLEALETGESFHLKTLEVTGAVSGRL